jgi:hypothetical protein
MHNRTKYRPAQAAEYLGCQESTLAWWRSRNQGPDYLKIGGRVFYLQTQLDAFIESGIRHVGG